MRSSDCEIAIAGGRWDEPMASFRITPEEVDMVDVGSNETKSRRRIFHILGNKQADSVGRLLVSELYADEGCWSGYPPHKHDTDRPGETAHEELDAALPRAEFRGSAPPADGENSRHRCHASQISLVAFSPCID